MARLPDLHPSISCVIPAFNEAGNLPHLLPALLKILKTMSLNIEVLVVDDGSRVGLLGSLSLAFTGILAFSLHPCALSACWDCRSQPWL